MYDPTGGKDSQNRLTAAPPEPFHKCSAKTDHIANTSIKR